MCSFVVCYQINGDYVMQCCRLRILHLWSANRFFCIHNRRSLIRVTFSYNATKLKNVFDAPRCLHLNSAKVDLTRTMDGEKKVPSNNYGEISLFTFACVSTFARSSLHQCWLNVLAYFARSLLANWTRPIAWAFHAYTPTHFMAYFPRWLMLKNGSQKKYGTKSIAMWTRDHFGLR